MLTAVKISRKIRRCSDVSGRKKNVRRCVPLQLCTKTLCTTWSDFLYHTDLGPTSTTTIQSWVQPVLKKPHSSRLNQYFNNNSLIQPVLQPPHSPEFNKYPENILYRPDIGFYIGLMSDVQLGYTSGRYRQPISAADMQPILCRHSKVFAFSRYITPFFDR